MPLDRSAISSELTDFSTTNGTLRAVKGTVEGNASQIALTRCCGKSPVSTKPVLHRVELTLKHPRRWIEVAFQVS
jgi:hypothetical protein